QYQLGFGKRPEEELYDLNEDPDHMNNLADDPDYQAIKEELSARLMDVLHEEEDPRVTEEPCRFERSPFTDPL
ncbi:MAG: sulfatase/phosphatase domain-containing protein, partial [Planctomycetota bacterium]